jgi:probable HAF family extracellular repeat protein
MTTSYSIKIRGFVVAAALSVGLGLVSPAFALDSWIVGSNGQAPVKLGTGNETYARGINDAGQVAGWFKTGFTFRPFITGPNGVGLTNIGSLGGDRGEAQGINATGQVVGYFGTATGETHAFITGPNGIGMTDLGTLGGSVSVASGINTAGQVAGTSSTGGADHAFITGPNGVGMTDLGTLGGDSSAAAVIFDTIGGINASGQVVGYSTTTGGDSHAFITGANGVGMTDLGTLGGLSSFASGINTTGQVVGRSFTSGGENHAFITGPNGVDMTDLGTLGGGESIAYGINDAGQVVGYSSTTGGDSHAFITGPNGVGMTDLNSLAHLPDGGFLYRATGINNSGQIIAISIIPEPATYALMLAGLGLTGFMVRRRRSMRGHFS